ncbi:LysR substrate-binding domain-containing protein [Roseiflexus castenholzii]|uniref:Transcriptional regulator, LysR family n=1 Tax=Roseiflexus castenholzii (strain DSM 13941 / HLO8) TaxID=383372 RepID=A7NL82_ROSCS|nr:LysR substrate-binding domain-containing protein [Roseiflexus castenholzii]ABU58255.1 transcriptional regulator, LysR family [Roseiflexus castenholzii DSM 13941]
MAAITFNHIYLDVASVEGPVDHSDLLLTPWREDDPVGIAAPDHPLAAQPSLRRATCTERLYPQSRFWNARDAGACIDAPWISIRVAMEPGSAEAIKQAVAARLGISVVSRVTIQIEPETRRLVLLPIADLTIRRSLTCVRHIDRPVSRALEAWLRMTSDDNETSPLSSGSQAPSP